MATLHDTYSKIDLYINVLGRALWGSLLYGMKWHIHGHPILNGKSLYHYGYENLCGCRNLPACFVKNTRGRKINMRLGID